MEKKFNLPDILKPFEEAILSTKLDFVKIKPESAVNLQWWESRIGGYPYLPNYVSYPKSDDGKALFFLAQINFEEMPSVKNFPEKGILQFYISDGGNYGRDMDKQTSQSTYRVLYFPDVIKSNSDLMIDFSFLSAFDDVPLSSDKAYRIKFEKDQEIAPTTDHRFDKKMGADFFMKFGEKEYDIKGVYDDAFSAASHKLGGYAHFTQDDPRMYKDDTATLLFQIDSDDEIACQWGDMGVAQFFIEEEDLIAKDFSKVTFNWDCL